MTDKEFMEAWDKGELNVEFWQYQFDNYPDSVSFESFYDAIVTDGQDLME